MLEARSRAIKSDAWSKALPCMVFAFCAFFSLEN